MYKVIVIQCAHLVLLTCSTIYLMLLIALLIYIGYNPVWFALLLSCCRLVLLSRVYNFLTCGGVCCPWTSPDLLLSCTMRCSLQEYYVGNQLAKKYTNTKAVLLIIFGSRIVQKIALCVRVDKFKAYRNNVMAPTCKPSIWSSFKLCVKKGQER